MILQISAVGLLRHWICVNYTVACVREGTEVCSPRRSYLWKASCLWQARRRSMQDPALRYLVYWEFKQPSSDSVVSPYAEAIQDHASFKRHRPFSLPPCVFTADRSWGDKMTQINLINWLIFFFSGLSVPWIAASNGACQNKRGNGEPHNGRTILFLKYQYSNQVRHSISAFVVWSSNTVSNTVYT